jgi:hypothetical protein
LFENYDDNYSPEVVEWGEDVGQERFDDDILPTLGNGRK